ncbi:MAG: hypothetical protein CSH49_14900 [Alcanivorax sp.]|nr:MAG: hypothetical protein CSH49_14900 [Alcanivorax sp.]
MNNHPTGTDNLKNLWHQSCTRLIKGVGRRWAGLERRSIELEQGRKYAYYDNNRQGKDVVLLIHGFNADKDHWIPLASRLKQYHIIAPDLCGHGDSWYEESYTHDIPFYVNELKKFVDALGLQRFHMVGNSMGGWITSLFCVAYPEDVRSVVLLNSVGIKPPVVSPFFKALSEGKNPFFFSNQAEFDQLLKLSVADVSAIPKSIKQVSYQEGLERMDRARKLFADIMDEDERLTHPDQMVDSVLANIMQPALIVWGDKDGIMDSSMADVFQRGIPNSQAVIMSNVGHVPMLECPKEAGRYIKGFLGSQVPLSVSLAAQ